MLAYLLDEHISPDVAIIVSTLRGDVAITSIFERNWASLSDDELLRKAATSALTLVTYDQRTVPALLQQWAESSRDHSGVIFVDERTVAPNDFGMLARSLIHFWDLHQGLDWTNRLAFLRRTA
jgi:hypothetical protein